MAAGREAPVPRPGVGRIDFGAPVIDVKAGVCIRQWRERQPSSAREYAMPPRHFERSRPRRHVRERPWRKVFADGRDAQPDAIDSPSHRLRKKIAGILASSWWRWCGVGQPDSARSATPELFGAGPAAQELSIRRTPGGADSRRAGDCSCRTRHHGDPSVEHLAVDSGGPRPHRCSRGWRAIGDTVKFRKQQR